MKSDPRELPMPLHWSLELPWLLAFFGILFFVVFRFDDGLLNQWKTTKNSRVVQDEALIELNTASMVELDLLPDVGPILAQRIIEKRPFASVEDLNQVQGIGPKLMKKLAPRVRVRLCIRH